MLRIVLRQSFNSHIDLGVSVSSGIFINILTIADDLKALLIVKRSPSPEAEAHHVKAAIPKLLELVVHKEEVSQPNVLTHPNKDLEEEDDLSDFTPEQRARVERHLARRSAVRT